MGKVCGNPSSYLASRLHVRHRAFQLTVGDPLTEQPENVIREAVQECLTRCYRGSTPLGVLAEFTAKLRDKGWTDLDIRKVESAVRKVLAGVVAKTDENPPD